MNPVAKESIVYFHTPDGPMPAYRHVMTYCPGCKSAHPFTTKVFDRPNGTPYSHNETNDPIPTWSWDGNLESPTFEPSMLAYYTVHLCPSDYVHFEVCPGGECGHMGHGLAWRLSDGSIKTYKVDEVKPVDAEEVYTVNLPHVVDPAYGNCHSFLRNGVWEFLGDSAHELANQKVPMVPLPNWLV